MKMFKKLMAVVLTGVMAVSMLTGCAVSDAIAKNELKDALNRAGKTSTTATDGNTHKYTSADSVKVNGNTYKMSDVATKVVNAVKKVETKKDEVNKNGEVYDATAVYGEGKYNVAVVIAPSSTSTDKWNALAGEANKYLENSYCTGSSNPKEIKVCVKKTSTKKASTDGKSYDVFVLVAYAG